MKRNKLWNWLWKDGKIFVAQAVIHLCINRQTSGGKGNWWKGASGTPFIFELY
jgi:hypothetical protein